MFCIPFSVRFATRDTLQWPMKAIATGVARMLHYAIVFLVVAIIAAVLGFGIIAGTAAWIAKLLFVVFLILAVVTFLRRAV
jgi:uncharacterized membrane protein YtjA (UPF0391 family)